MIALDRKQMKNGGNAAFVAGAGNHPFYIADLGAGKFRLLLFLQGIYDLIQFRVADVQVLFIGLPGPEPGARRPIDDPGGDPQLPGQFPHLGLGQVADGKRSTPPSPCLVKYPMRRSDLLPVPATR